jgi:hypothetical protein
MACKFCESWTEVRATVCSRCRERLGLIDGVPPRRPPPSCNRCSHPELIRVFARELAFVDAALSPMAATCAPGVAKKLLSNDPNGIGVEAQQRTKRFGLLEMYVCRQCGFTEWYCRDPENIPIGEEYGTELMKAR